MLGCLVALFSRFVFFPIRANQLTISGSIALDIYQNNTFLHPEDEHWDVLETSVNGSFCT